MRLLEVVGYDNIVCLCNLMSGKMVTETWFGSLRWISWKNTSETGKGGIGILAFEVASLMLKVVNMWHSLRENEVNGLREQIVNSVGIQKLVSDNAEYLMDLAVNEIIENFGNVAKSVARLGKRCTDPVYHCFEDFINDPLINHFEWFGWAYRLKKMERKVKKMEKFAAVMMQLCQELEVLAELEQTLRRMQANKADRVKLLEYQQKVACQRQEVRNLREMSPWVRSYDYVVRLLVRSLFTILERTRHAFGNNQIIFIEGNSDCGHSKTKFLSRSHSFSVPIISSEFSSDKGVINSKQRRSLHQSDSGDGKLFHSKSKRLGHVGSFGGCITGVSDSLVVDSCKPAGSASMRYGDFYMKTIEKMERTHVGSLSSNNKLYSKLFTFSFKLGLLNAPPSTLGEAALALHYANIVVLIERLASSPHMIGPDERDVLYNMLPMNIKTALRGRLKAYAKTLVSSAYDVSLAERWNLALTQILGWLSPLAHNMIRWQSERNFEKEDVVSRTNVLLVQTLHYANRAKTEAAITELLVGLNYVCRVGREVTETAVLKLSASKDRAIVCL